MKGEECTVDSPSWTGWWACSPTHHKNPRSIRKVDMASSKVLVEPCPLPFPSWNTLEMKEADYYNHFQAMLDSHVINADQVFMDYIGYIVCPVSGWPSQCLLFSDGTMGLMNGPRKKYFTPLNLSKYENKMEILEKCMNVDIPTVDYAFFQEAELIVNVQRPVGKGVDRLREPVPRFFGGEMVVEGDTESGDSSSSSNNKKYSGPTMTFNEYKAKLLGGSLAYGKLVSKESPPPPPAKTIQDRCRELGITMVERGAPIIDPNHLRMFITKQFKRIDEIDLSNIVSQTLTTPRERRAIECNVLIKYFKNFWRKKHVGSNRDVEIEGKVARISRSASRASSDKAQSSSSKHGPKKTRKKPNGNAESEGNVTTVAAGEEGETEEVAMEAEDQIQDSKFGFYTCKNSGGGSRRKRPEYWVSSVKYINANKTRPTDLNNDIMARRVSRDTKKAIKKRSADKETASEKIYKALSGHYFVDREDIERMRGVACIPASSIPGNVSGLMFDLVAVDGSGASSKPHQLAFVRVPGAAVTKSSSSPPESGPGRQTTAAAQNNNTKKKKTNDKKTKTKAAVVEQPPATTPAATAPKSSAAAAEVRRSPLRTNTKEENVPKIPDRAVEINRPNSDAFIAPVTASVDNTTASAVNITASALLNSITLRPSSGAKGTMESEGKDRGTGLLLDGIMSPESNAFVKFSLDMKQRIIYNSMFEYTLNHESGSFLKGSDYEEIERVSRHVKASVGALKAKLSSGGGAARNAQQHGLGSIPTKDERAMAAQVGVFLKDILTFLGDGYKNIIKEAKVSVAQESSAAVNKKKSFETKDLMMVLICMAHSMLARPPKWFTETERERFVASKVEEALKKIKMAAQKNRQQQEANLPESSSSQGQQQDGGEEDKAMKDMQDLFGDIIGADDLMVVASVPEQPQPRAGGGPDPHQQGVANANDSMDLEDEAAATAAAREVTPEEIQSLRASTRQKYMSRLMDELMATATAAPPKGGEGKAKSLAVVVPEFLRVMQMWVQLPQFKSKIKEFYRDSEIKRIKSARAVLDVAEGMAKSHGQHYANFYLGTVLGFTESLFEEALDDAVALAFKVPGISLSDRPPQKTVESVSSFVKKMAEESPQDPSSPASGPLYNTIHRLVSDNSLFPILVKILCHPLRNEAIEAVFTLHVAANKSE